MKSILIFFVSALAGSIFDDFESFILVDFKRSKRNIEFGSGENSGESSGDEVVNEEEQFKVEVEFSIDLINFDDLTSDEKDTLLGDLESELQKDFATSNPFENGETIVSISEVNNNETERRKRRETETEFKVIVEYSGHEEPSVGSLLFQCRFWYLTLN